MNVLDFSFFLRPLQEKEKHEAESDKLRRDLLDQENAYKELEQRSEGTCIVGTDFFGDSLFEAFGGARYQTAHSVEAPASSLFIKVTHRSLLGTKPMPDTVCGCVPDRDKCADSLVQRKPSVI